MKLAGLAAAGVLALTGCASGNPQVAAYVGDQTISQSEVDAVAKVLADSTSDTTDTGGGYAATVVQIMIQGKVAQAAAAEKNITVSDADRQKTLASNTTLAALAKNPVSTTFINDYVDTGIILGTAEGQAATKELLSRTTIRVNPRFGVWDATTYSLVDGSTGSLSEAAPIKQE
jgi:hypothetical protein